VNRPSNHQLEKHIRQCAQDSCNIVFVHHARERMRQRRINDPMVLETLRRGVLTREPEPDTKTDGLRCVMERYVSGIDVAVIVLVDHPAPNLTVITVMEVTKG
jgi:hypothetical protein